MNTTNPPTEGDQKFRVWHDPITDQYRAGWMRFRDGRWRSYGSYRDVTEDVAPIRYQVVDRLREMFGIEATDEAEVFAAIERYDASRWADRGVL